MEKVVIWGIGENMKFYLMKNIYFHILIETYHIIALVDKNPLMWGSKLRGFKIFSPQQLGELEYDYIIIGVVMEDELREELIHQYGISKDKILSYKILEEKLVDKLILLYQDSEDVEIKKILQYYRKSGFNIFGYYQGDNSCQNIERDNDGMPYIFFENRKMYFPPKKKYKKAGSGEVVRNILFEQGTDSPHLYVRDVDEIPNGSVIVDAGACEGNFVLRYIDRVKRAYIIESDEDWVMALRRTLKGYEDKVVICDKYLTRYDSQTTITLDSLVTEKIDFLKMDIEGYEVDALLGAKNLLRDSNARCAICSYHKQNDEENIKFILSNLGYKTSVSNGYMFFVYDDDIADSMDFRKGIVYGEKSFAT